MSNKNTNFPGVLITFEGGEGAGKTTQIVRLREHFFQYGKEVIILREPGGTAISEQIREVVLSAKNIGISFTTEVLLYQAARAQIYREIVLPSLEAGKVVLMDRSRDSSVVYQGIVRDFGEELIEQLNNFSTKNTYPDLTFLLDIDPKIGLARRKDDGFVNRLDMESFEFHQKVQLAYLKLAKKNDRKRWHILDAGQKIEEIEDGIWQIVSKKLYLS